MVSFINNNQLSETHVHADHLTASDTFKHKFPEAKTGIGANICAVQQHFGPVFNMEVDTLHNLFCYRW